MPNSTTFVTIVIEAALEVLHAIWSPDLQQERYRRPFLQRYCTCCMLANGVTFPLALMMALTQLTRMALGEVRFSV